MLDMPLLLVAELPFAVDTIVVAVVVVETDQAQCPLEIPLQVVEMDIPE
jgi:hypothetical protein